MTRTIEEWRDKALTAGNAVAVVKFNEYIREREVSWARVAELAVTNPGSARLLARKLGLR